jgi:predicted transcriptional regulator of viral defense system
MRPTPGKEIKTLPENSFVSARDIETGTDLAKRSALTRAVKAGDLIRVRAGLYYKGESTRFGMTHPNPRDVAKVMIRSAGAGPAGYSAARHLGLTTQVPAEVHIATVDGAHEVAPAGVRLHSRNNVLRRELNETEIAVLEVLRDPMNLAERGWPSLVEVVKDRVDAGEVHVDRVREAARWERSKATHEYSKRLWSDLAIAA